jgi:hypothetical protein
MRLSWCLDRDEYVSSQNNQMKIFTLVYADHVRMGGDFGYIYLPPTGELKKF